MRTFAEAVRHCLSVRCGEIFLTKAAVSAFDAVVLDAPSLFEWIGVVDVLPWPMEIFSFEADFDERHELRNIPAMMMHILYNRCFIAMNGYIEKKKKKYSAYRRLRHTLRCTFCFSALSLVSEIAFFQKAMACERMLRRK